MRIYVFTFLILFVAVDAFARSYYDVLSVDPQATESEIRDQYRKLASQHHPDRYINVIEKRRHAVELSGINAAKAVLMNTGLRYYYDLVSHHGADHGSWTALPNKNLEALGKTFGPVRARPTLPIPLADQLANVNWRRRFIERSLAPGAPVITDVNLQREVLKTLRGGHSEDLAEVVAAKFVFTDSAIAAEMVELKKTSIGVAITEQAIRHRTTNQVFHITQNEAIGYLHARANETDLEVSRRARQAINSLGLPPDPLYPIKSYLQKVQRCYGAH